MKNRIDKLDAWMRQRGSALLVTLMVIVGLSLLGLGFVAMSETESAISINERNYAQTLTNDEAALKVVVDLFQSPQWANSIGLLPPNDNAFKIDRVVNDSSGSYTGKYKPDNAKELLFDLPFKPGKADRFYGDEDHADVKIDYTTTAGTTYLDTFNSKLFPGTPSAGTGAQEPNMRIRVVEIKVYAPSVVAGTNTAGFIVGGDRYGVATIKVTAEKQNTLTNEIIARRVVKAVVTEFPFPGPNGPIQSNSSISVTGAFNVYWGEVSARTDLTFKTVGGAPSSVKGFPWVDAWERANFEHGYDSSTTWKPTTAYSVNDLVHATSAARTATADLGLHAFKATAVTGNTSGTEPAWTTTPGATYTDGGVTWTEQAATMYPNFGDGTKNRDLYNWFYEVNTMSFDDIWAQARSRGRITNAAIYTVPIPNSKSDPTLQGGWVDPTVPPNSPWSGGGSNDNIFSWFQLQTVNNKPDYQIVDFPRIDYEFWKSIAIAGDGQTGIHYLVWSSADLFYSRANPAAIKSVREWTNSCPGTGTAEPGFYFFDTQNQKNPQSGGPGVLTPAVIVDMGGLGGGCLEMQGFIYLNAVSFGTKGTPKGNDILYNYPGEPYRDVGYRKVDPLTGLFMRDGLGRLQGLVDANNQKWDYQEVNGDGIFNLVLKNVGGKPRPDGTSFPNPTMVPAEYWEGCTIGTNCSEPHEPYLNVQYPVDSGSVAKASPTAATIGWQAIGATAATTVLDGLAVSQKRLAVQTADTARLTAVDCTVAANYPKCTSNGYDRDGPVAFLGLGGPMLNGVLYNEGIYDAQGNACYYGSLLIQGDVTGTGTPTVYFDESLLKGDFKKKFPNFPRVYISAQQSDEE